MRLEMNLSNEDYHAREEASRSDVMMYKQNPELYHATKVLGLIKDKPPSPSMAFGIAVDEWLTEKKPPTDVLPEHVVVMPKGMIRRGVKWDEFQEKNKGNEIWSHSEHEKWLKKQGELLEAIRWIERSVMAHAQATILLKDPTAIYQPSFFSDDGWKCRPDFIIPHVAIVDIKTTRDSRARHMERACVDYGYHIQGGVCQRAWAMYEHSDSLLPFILLCIENTPPHTVETYQLADEFCSQGWFEFCDLLDAINDKKWHRPSHGRLIELGKPAWLDKTAEYVVPLEDNPNQE